MPKKNLHQRLRGKWSAKATDRHRKHAWHDRHIMKEAQKRKGGHIPRDTIQPMTLSLSELVDWSQVLGAVIIPNEAAMESPADGVPFRSSRAVLPTEMVYVSEPERTIEEDGSPSASRNASTF